MIKPGSTLYYATHKLPADQRAMIETIHAIHDELFSIILKCQESMAARLRLQWWRDAVSKLKQHKAEHPLLQRLQTSSLEVGELFCLINGIASYFDSEGFESERAVRQFIQDTTGARDRLIANILAVGQQDLAQLPSFSEACARVDYARHCARYAKTGFFLLPQASATSVANPEQREKILEKTLINLNNLMFNNDYFKSLSSILTAQKSKLRRQRFKQTEPALDIAPLYKWWLSR
ncbi:MAG: hypothetical protein COV52_00075 [Gammaproteobacteria bacterium CG11_big_fil_rev_8_21_14_0_20_46_22]|nr:MAG: hypothetical protein COW05_09300 [Gammaproteobacteria bacterium CG12_big_fil_rev_8_21_14_0_65_46_12]PIR12163.1 MAG: hypothetical protein COV52_00075 [Gammaproteobacteria bacterium CG11_big_fil_rev_8_21_14_0_20_46_22]